MDMWSALDTTPRPALLYAVTVPVELGIVSEFPLVLTRTARYARYPVEEATPDIRHHIGGIVRTRQGEPLPGALVRLEGSGRAESSTDTDGRFVLPGVPHGNVTLQVTYSDQKPKRVKITVPDTSYDITMD